MTGGWALSVNVPVEAGYPRTSRPQTPGAGLNNLLLGTPERREDDKLHQDKPEK